MLLVPLALAGPGVPGEEAPPDGIDAPAPAACAEVEALLREARRRTGLADRVDAAISPACRAEVDRGAWTSLVPLVRGRVLYDRDGYPTVTQRPTDGQVRALCRLRPRDGIAEMRAVVEERPDGGLDADLCVAGLAARLDDAAFAEAVSRWMRVTRELGDIGPWTFWGAERVAAVAPRMSADERERFAPMLAEADAREATNRDALRAALCAGAEARGPRLQAACDAHAADEEAVRTGRRDRTNAVVRVAAKCLGAVGWWCYALHAAGPAGTVPRRGRTLRAEVTAASAFVATVIPAFFWLLWQLGPPEGMLLPISGIVLAGAAGLGAFLLAASAAGISLMASRSPVAVLVLATLASLAVLAMDWVPLPSPT
ncbi:MAG: hypothetical protein ACOZNI_04545 [Myxococcota bacterium]